MLTRYDDILRSIMNTFSLKRGVFFLEYSKIYVCSILQIVESEILMHSFVINNKSCYYNMLHNMKIYNSIFPCHMRLRFSLVWCESFSKYIYFFYNEKISGRHIPNSLFILWIRYLKYKKNKYKRNSKLNILQPFKILFECNFFQNNCGVFLRLI